MARVLYGTAADNQINVDADSAQAYGLAGNDSIISDKKNDALLIGGSGDDKLIVMGGTATLSGGAGADVFELNYSAEKKLSAVIEDFEPASDKIVVNFDGEKIPQLSSVMSGRDIAWKDSYGNFNLTLKSVRDNDYFDGEADKNVWEVLELTNAEREAQSLSPLTMSEGLTAGASIRVQEINALGQTGALNKHERTDGSDWRTVFDEIGKEYNFPGENLDGGASSPSIVLEHWMNSDDHRKNILDARFQKLGVGYKYDNPDPSDQRFYWTQWFADSLTSDSLGNPETVETSELLTAKIEVAAVSQFTLLTEGNDTFSNENYGVTIDAGNGFNRITNAGLNVSIFGGKDSDTISSNGSFATINAGAGNDSISLDSKENVIQYAQGDGNDSISGLSSSDTLCITGGEYTYATIGSDVIVSVGNDSITLLDAASLPTFHIDGTWSRFYIGTEGNDTIDNRIEKASTIQALGGNDSIYNYGANSLIDGGKDSDTISSNGANDSIYGGDGDDNLYSVGNVIYVDGGNGNDSIRNTGVNSSINGAEGNDTIYNSGYNNIINGGADNDSIYNIAISVTITGGAGNDSIQNWRYDVSISGGEGDDSVYNSSLGTNVSIDLGAGNDSIYSRADSITIDGGADRDYIRNGGYYLDDGDWYNGGANVSIFGGDSNDTIINYFGNYATILGGEGDDSISNSFGDNLSITGGAGNDSIYNHGESVAITGGKGKDSIRNNSGDNSSIEGGAGDDTISLNFYDSNILIQYTQGDGNDIISGFNETDTLSITGGDYIRSTINNDLVFAVGTDSIILLNAAKLSTINVIGEGSEGNFVNGFIELTEDADIYRNNLKNATISALGGNDSITNAAMNVSISGGAGNDTIYNSGAQVSILGGEGKDYISNVGDSITIDAGLDDDIISIGGAIKNLIAYLPGDGNDSIYGFDENATLEINRVTGNVSTLTSDNNFIVNVGTGSVMIAAAANFAADNIKVNWDKSPANIITLSESNDYYDNTDGDVTLAALGGNDTIFNDGANSSIDAGADDDSIYNEGKNSSINSGTGDDYIRNNSERVLIDGAEGSDHITNSEGKNVSIIAGDDDDYIYSYTDSDSISIDGGLGNDYIENNGASPSITGGLGNDSIFNDGSNALVQGGNGNDSIFNDGANSSITGGNGNDSIYSSGANSSINGGADNDSIYNDGGDNSAFEGGLGNDSISNFGDNVSLFGGAGNDYIANRNSFFKRSSDATIDSGEGVDTINNYGDNVSINSGAGNDSILSGGDSVSIYGGSGNDSIDNFGDNVSINGGAGNDSIRNWGGNDVTINGGAGNDLISLTSASKIHYVSGDGDDSIWGFNSRTTITVWGEKTYESVGSGEDIIVKVGSGSITLKNARNKPLPIIIGESGSSGGGSGGGGGSSSGGSSGSGSGGSSGNGGGSSTGGTSSSEGRGSDASGGKSSSGSSGGYGGRGSSGSSSGRGSSTVSNSADNSTAQSDTTSAPKEKISLESLLSFSLPPAKEIINKINAADGSSILWGSENDDTIYGSDGDDIFIGGKNQGSDLFLNVSSTDVVYLGDVSFKDIAGVKKNNDMITFSFTTGNVVNIQCSDSVSGAIVFADSTWRFAPAIKD